jgi:hypothetical protein
LHLQRSADGNVVVPRFTAKDFSTVEPDPAVAAACTASSAPSPSSSSDAHLTMQKLVPIFFSDLSNLSLFASLLESAAGSSSLRRTCTSYELLVILQLLQLPIPTKSNLSSINDVSRFRLDRTTQELWQCFPFKRKEEMALRGTKPTDFWPMLHKLMCKLLTKECTAVAHPQCQTSERDASRCRFSERARLSLQSLPDVRDTLRSWSTERKSRKRADLFRCYEEQVSNVETLMGWLNRKRGRSYSDSNPAPYSDSSSDSEEEEEEENNEERGGEEEEKRNDEEKEEEEEEEENSEESEEEEKKGGED